VGSETYTIFKLDVTNDERVISVYKEYKYNSITYNSRGLLINNKFYVVGMNELIIDNWQ
jgi:hypothetical protein